jgi:hypothetical protein
MDKLIHIKIGFFTIFSIECILVASCSPKTGENPGRPKASRLEIEFTNEIRNHNGVKCGIFEITNKDTESLNVNIMLDADLPYYDQPVYDRLYKNTWERVDVGYAGIVLFSSIRPGESFTFYAPIDILDEYKGGIFRMVVMEGYSKLNYSNPFTY